MNQLKHYPQNFVDTFVRHLKMINLIGLDVLDDSNINNFKKNGKFLAFFIFLCLMLFGQVLYIVKRKEMNAQFLDVVSAIPSILLALQDCLIAAEMFLKRNNLRHVIMKIGEVWPVNVECEDKTELLNYWTQNLKFFGNSFFRAAIISLIFFELEPLAIMVYGVYKENNVQYQLPLPMYSFGFLTSHYAYALMYMYQCITITLAHMSLYIPCALLLVDLTYNLSALLSLLKIDLENLVLSPKPKFTFEEDDSCEDIKSIVLLHQKLLRFFSFLLFVNVFPASLFLDIAKEVNAIFGFIIFVQVSCSSVIICCYGFMAMVADGMFLKYLTATLGILFGTFVLSWPGQILANTSFEIADAAYKCQWYERGKKFRQYIAIIITRSQTPCYLSALGFSNITLAMFTKIISTSWSYLSLLNQMYEDFDF